MSKLRQDLIDRLSQFANTWERGAFEDRADHFLEKFIVEAEEKGEPDDQELARILFVVQLYVRTRR